VIDALRGILELRVGEHAGVDGAADSEPLSFWGVDVERSSAVPRHPVAERAR
jgi:hypothetical protein